MRYTLTGKHVSKRVKCSSLSSTLKNNGLLFLYHWVCKVHTRPTGSLALLETSKYPGAQMHV